MQKFKLENKGITLIALVITIIILLILAGVSIAGLTGDNGLINRTNDSKVETDAAAVEEQVMLWRRNKQMNKYSDLNTDTISRDALLDDLYGKKLLTYEQYMEFKGGTERIQIGSKEIYIPLDDGASGGEIPGGGGSGEEPSDEVKIADVAKVGDYVSYNPTVTNKEGSISVNSAALTYKSPIGTAASHGNGSSEQIFKATSNTKWRILSINSENNSVELISEDVITPENSTEFVLSGARGYLYAEQELHSACSIFGYGYGADLNKGGTYTVGGPLDIAQTKKIEGTGARSMQVEDINKIAKVGETVDGVNVLTSFKELWAKYGEINPTVEVYYPTIDTNRGNPQTGISTVSGAKNLKSTIYFYEKTRISEGVTQNMIFNGDYWLSSRNLRCEPEASFYNTFAVIGNNLAYVYINQGLKTEMIEMQQYNKGKKVRPVVTLKSGAIDTTNVTPSTGTIGNPWQLK